MPDVYLRPGHATPSDVTLRDPTQADAGGATVTPGIATLVLTGFAPQLQESTSPAAASLVLTGQTAQLAESLAPAIAALTLTGETSTVNVGTNLQPAVATLTISGATSTVNVSDNLSLTPAIATLSLAGIAPALIESIPVDAATLTLAGETATVTVAGSVTAEPMVASLTLTGVAPNVIDSGFVPPQPGGGTTPPSVRWRRAVVFDPVLVVPQTVTLRLRGRVPSVHATGNVTLSPGVAVLTLIGEVPGIWMDAWMREYEREREEEALLLGIGELERV